MGKLARICSQVPNSRSLAQDHEAGGEFSEPTLTNSDSLYSHLRSKNATANATTQQMMSANDARVERLRRNVSVAQNGNVGTTWLHMR